MILGTACQLAVRGHNHEANTHNAIRVGVSRGEVMTGAAGMHGRPIQEGARLCAAQPSEILVTDALHQEMSDHPGLAFGDSREITAKGLGTRTTFPLIWTTPQP